MNLHFKKEDLHEKQEFSALTTSLEWTALDCVMTKSQYQRFSAEKILR